MQYLLSVKYKNISIIKFDINKFTENGKILKHAKEDIKMKLKMPSHFN